VSLFTSVQILCIAAVFAAGAFAQEFRATLTGRVVDPSEAAVPGVAVQTRNIETNETSHAVTDHQGNYTASFLRPGAYEISAVAPGFKKFLREGLILNIGQTATVDIRLEIGGLAEQVTVSDERPLLDSAKADRGGIVDQQRVHELPLNARNPMALAALAPGVAYAGALANQRPFDNPAIGQWSVNGGPASQNEFLLDGAPNGTMNGPAAAGHGIAYVPPVDSVQEFKIQTNSYDAQYGKTGGGIINVSLKSGSNNFHGALYEFARRNGWDANSFQNNSRGTPRSGHYLDQYGVQVGGPVYLPKLYDGRNRTFFMANYEGYREGTPQPYTLSVPEPEMLNGDFSKLADGQGRRIAIYDPTTGRDVNGVWTRDPFPGNVIPGGRINSIARNILRYMPKPNTSTAGAGYSNQNYYVAGGENVSNQNFYNLVVKIDQNMGDRNRFFFRHASNNFKLWSSLNGIRQAPGEDGNQPQWKINDAYVLDWVTTAKPNLAINMRGSVNHFINRVQSSGNQGFDKTTLGFPASLVSQLPNGAWFGRYQFSGYTTLGRINSESGTNTVAAHPTLTYIRGSHSIKSGLDMRWMQAGSKNAGNPFLLAADPGFTQKAYNRADALSGNSIATWLLGTPSSGQADYNPFLIYLYKYYAPYVQDDWKVTSRLTLNLGLRLDFNIAPNERYNRMTRGFDANAVNPVNQLIDRSKFPALPTIKGGLLFAGVNGVPRTATDASMWNLQPRFGAAYRVGDKLVLRGGWGRYYLDMTNDILQANGFSQSTPLVPSLDGGRTVLPNLLNNPLPEGVQSPPGSSLGLQTFLGRGFSFVNPKFDLPHVNQFSFGLQRELPSSSKIDVSYVGSRSKRLSTSRSANEYNLAFRQSCNLMEGGNPLYCDQQLPNPFQGLAPFAGTGNFTAPALSRAALASPYPEFGNLTQIYRNDGSTWYNSLQITLERRFKAGLNLTAAYTLSKMVEESAWNDVQQNVMRRGLSDLDHPHRLVVSSVYELPFGKGRRFLNGSHPLWSRLVTGWQSTVIFSWQSGQPWSLPANVLYVKEARLGDINWSANQVYGVKPCVAQWNDDGTITMQKFSAAAGCTDYNFLITPRYAPRFTPANDGRLRMQTAPTADVSLNKATRIAEKFTLQFRAEAFNVTNTYLFYGGSFINNPQNASFGSLLPSTVAFNQTNLPRNLQFAVKLIW
jgi:hypothetical protein